VNFLDLKVAKKIVPPPDLVHRAWCGTANARQGTAQHLTRAEVRAVARKPTSKKERVALASGSIPTPLRPGGRRSRSQASLLCSGHMNRKSVGRPRVRPDQRAADIVRVKVSPPARSPNREIGGSPATPRYARKGESVADPRRGRPEACVLLGRNLETVNIIARDQFERVSTCSMQAIGGERGGTGQDSRRSTNETERCCSRFWRMLKSAGH